MKCKYLQRLQNVAHDILTPDLPSPLQVCQAKRCAHASESEAQNSMTEGGRGQGYTVRSVQCQSVCPADGVPGRWRRLGRRQ